MIAARLLSQSLSRVGADQRHYQLDAGGPLPAYVVVSAVSVPFDGPETYIFTANSEGAITSYMELEGSFKGGLDHAEALRRAGYEVSL